MKLENYIKFSNGKKKPNEDGDIPVFGGNGILCYTNKYNSENDSLIIGRVGAYCGCVYKCDTPCWISDNAILGKVKEDNDYNFFYYLLKSININFYHTGAAQPLMTQNILNEIEVKVPDYSLQKKISKILLNIDKKINLNNHINDNLFELIKQNYNKLMEEISDESIIKLSDVCEISSGKRQKFNFKI